MPKKVIKEKKNKKTTTNKLTNKNKNKVNVVVNVNSNNKNKNKKLITNKKNDNQMMMPSSSPNIVVNVPQPVFSLPAPTYTPPIHTPPSLPPVSPHTPPIFSSHPSTFVPPTIQPIASLPTPILKPFFLKPTPPRQQRPPTINPHLLRPPFIKPPPPPPRIQPVPPPPPPRIQPILPPSTYNSGNTSLVSSIPTIISSYSSHTSLDSRPNFSGRLDDASIAQDYSNMYNDMFSDYSSAHDTLNSNFSSDHGTSNSEKLKNEDFRLHYKEQLNNLDNLIKNTPKLPTTRIQKPSPLIHDLTNMTSPPRKIIKNKHSTNKINDNLVNSFSGYLEEEEKQENKSNNPVLVVPAPIQPELESDQVLLLSKAELKKIDIAKKKEKKKRI